jgi:hypothetical protein
LWQRKETNAKIKALAKKAKPQTAIELINLLSVIHQ